MKQINIIKRIKKDYDIKQLCTLKIGGACKFFIAVNNLYELKTIIKYCQNKQINYFIIGNGSNLLFGDKGYDGMIIKLVGDFKKISHKNNIVKCGAGVNLFALNDYLCRQGIGGMEWSNGIPGTIGGAVIMNAGAFGNEMSEVVLDLLILHNNKIIKLNKNNIRFNYRKSTFLLKKTELNRKNIIILKIKLKLIKRNSEDCIYNCKNYLEKRVLRQPYNCFSAGSVFLRQDNIIPAKIIDELHLKGTRIGGAEVSNVHAGFIVNVASSSCQDVLDLIEYIKKLVFEKTGVFLKEEIEKVGT